MKQILQNILKRYPFLLVVAGAIVILDQVSKAYIRMAFSGPEGLVQWAPWDWLLPYFRIIYVTNTGVAFGMFQGMWMIFAVLAAFVSIAIIYYFYHVPENDWVLRLSMSMMLAGALGNLIDRLTQQGRVTDFISVGNFPVFNVADSSITVGAVILAFDMLIHKLRELRAQNAESLAEPGVENDAPQQENQAG